MSALMNQFRFVFAFRKIIQTFAPMVAAFWGSGVWGFIGFGIVFGVERVLGLVLFWDWDCSGSCIFRG